MKRPDALWGRIRPALAGLAILLIACSGRPAGVVVEHLVRNGDIIFQTSHSSQSVAIQRATGSAFSHVGLIFFQHGKPYVLEAIGTVRYTPLRPWIARGTDGQFVVKRLRNADRALDREGVKRLREQARRFEGKPYDAVFGWSDKRIYCSELVWKVYDRALGIRLGRLRHLKEFRLEDPLVAHKLKERYGAKVPLEEWVISPADIYRSDEIVTVTQQ